MLPVRASLTADQDVLRAIRQDIRTVPRRMRREFGRTVTRASSRLLKRLRNSQPEQLPGQPFIWSYDPEAQARARRWVYANLVRPGRTRYERTGGLVRNYKTRINLSDDAGLINIENDTPGGVWVIGELQVPSHFLTGWETIDETARRFREELNDDLIETWFAVTSE